MIEKYIKELEKVKAEIEKANPNELKDLIGERNNLVETIGILEKREAEKQAQELQNLNANINDLRAELSHMEHQATQEAIQILKVAMLQVKELEKALVKDNNDFINDLDYRIKDKFENYRCYQFRNVRIQEILDKVGVL